MIRKLALFSLLLLMQTHLLAQNAPVEMADNLRSNGKIFVVVAVILTIFAGILIYLIRLDRKITKIEKNNFNH